MTWKGDQMNQETINKIRQALEQATPGPWRKGTFNVWCDDEDSCICDLGQGVRYWYDGGLRNYMRQDTEERAFADSCLIPLLRNHAPALLDEIERLQEELNRWTGVFAGITPENMRQRMSDLSIANAQLTARVAELTAELDDYCRADANINYALNEGDRNINHETAQP